MTSDTAKLTVLVEQVARVNDVTLRTNSEQFSALVEAAIGPGVEQLAAAADTHYVTAAFTVASPLREGIALTAYVDDEGLMDPTKPLKIVLRYPGGHVTAFAGNMVMTGLDLRTGETVSLSDGEVALLRRLRRTVPVFPLEGYLLCAVVFYDFARFDAA